MSVHDAETVTVGSMSWSFERAEYVLNAHQPSQLPADVGIEIAIAGRSNSGKSSTINALCRRRNLARTSRTPGRTQQMVVFDLGDGRRLVDLPGFGYAKVAADLRRHWERALPEYLQTRVSLRGLVLVTDIRHPLKAEEERLLRWCAEAGLPAHLVLNKADKLSRNQARQAHMKLTAYLRSLGDGLSTGLLSAAKGDGIDELRAFLVDWLDRVEPARTD